MSTLNSLNSTVSSSSLIDFVSGGSIGIDQGGAERSHHIEGTFRDRIEPGVGRVVTGEEPPIDPDPRAPQRPVPQGRPVVARERAGRERLRTASAGR